MREDWSKMDFDMVFKQAEQFCKCEPSAAKAALDELCCCELGGISVVRAVYTLGRSSATVTATGSVGSGCLRSSSC